MSTVVQVEASGKSKSSPVGRNTYSHLLDSRRIGCRNGSYRVEGGRPDGHNIYVAATRPRISIPIPVTASLLSSPNMCSFRVPVHVDGVRGWSFRARLRRSESEGCSPGGKLFVRDLC
jgi:hypothetical protein